MAEEWYYLTPSPANDGWDLSDDKTRELMRLCIPELTEYFESEHDPDRFHIVIYSYSVYITWNVDYANINYHRSRHGSLWKDAQNAEKDQKFKNLHILMEHLGVLRC